VTCDQSTDLIASLRSASLGDAGREALSHHVTGCPACREALLDADPSYLFAELAGEPLPPDLWAGFQKEILARLPEGRPGAGWAALFRYPRLAYAAPLAAAVLLGVTVLVVRPDGIFAPGRPGAIRPPYARPDRLARPGRPLAPAGPGALVPAGGVSGGSSAPLLEEAGSPGARIYRFDAGAPGGPERGGRGEAAAGEDEAPIYLVVDETIDL